MEFHEESDQATRSSMADTMFDTDSLLEGIELARTTAVTTLGRYMTYDLNLLD